MQIVKKWDHSLVFFLKSSSFRLIKKLFSGKKIGLKMESVSTPIKKEGNDDKNKNIQVRPTHFQIILQTRRKRMGSGLHSWQPHILGW
jgi:hypothetical protein